MIQATLKMKFTPQKLDEALEILRSIIERTKAEAGCIGCSVFQDTTNVHEVVFFQKWRSNGDLQRHLRSESYKKVLIVMEMAHSPPDIRFETITNASGVETIEDARIEKEKKSSK